LGACGDFEELRAHPFFAPIDWEKLVRRAIKPPFVPKTKYFVFFLFLGFLIFQNN
jgi:protein-serine/threonine kinase